MENRLGGWRWKLDTLGEEVGSLVQMDKALCMTIIEEVKPIAQDLVKRLQNESPKLKHGKSKRKKRSL